MASVFSVCLCADESSLLNNLGQDLHFPTPISVKRLKYSFGTYTL